MGSVVGGREDVEDDERERVGLSDAGSVGESAIVVDAKVLVAASAEKGSAREIETVEDESIHRIQ